MQAHGFSSGSALSGRRRLLGMLASAAVGLPSATVGAQPDESPACARMRAEAASRASLMYAPTVQAEVVRLPRAGDDTGEGLFRGEGTQVRASLSYSLLDLWRGTVVERSAERSCEELGAQERIGAWLASAADAAEREALEAQLAVLVEAAPTVDAIEARAERLLAERRATLGQIDGLLGGVGRLRRARLRAESAVAEIPPDVEARTPEAVAADVRAYLAAAEARHDEDAQLRRLRGWDLRLRGGVIPQQDVDWYGAVELRWNVGSLVQPGHEARAAAAHRRALRERRDGLVERVRRLEAHLAETARRLDAELVLLEAERARVEARRDALRRHEGAATVAARDAAELRVIELAAERAYLASLRGSHAPFLSPSPSPAPSREPPSPESM